MVLVYRPSNCSTCLTAKNIKEGRRGSIFGAFLKLTPLFIFLIPGVVALVLKQRGELHWDTPDQAFPSLMMTLLPAGLRGLVAAGFNGGFNVIISFGF